MLSNNFLLKIQISIYFLFIERLGILQTSKNRFFKKYLIIKYDALGIFNNKSHTEVRIRWKVMFKTIIVFSISSMVNLRQFSQNTDYDHCSYDSWKMVP